MKKKFYDKETILKHRGGGSAGLVKDHTLTFFFLGPFPKMDDWSDECGDYQRPARLHNGGSYIKQERESPDMIRGEFR